MLNSFTRYLIIQADEITIELDPTHLGKRLNIELPSECAIAITKLFTLKKRGQEKKLVVGGLQTKPTNINQLLIKLVAKAHLLKSDLQSGKVCSIKEWAKVQNMHHADAKNLVPLSYLAPSIIEDILGGHQPTDLTATTLKSAAFNLPTMWSEQRKKMGFSV